MIPTKLTFPRFDDTDTIHFRRVGDPAYNRKGDVSLALLWAA
jgi:hypothetical protein